MDLALIVDVETTGLDPKKDAIIEIGLLQFGVGSDGTTSVVGMYGGLEDPGREIPPEIVKLTGIRGETLVGQKINWDLVRSMLTESEVVIAHNAKFDRSFLMKRPELADMQLHWACSASHINWERHGYRTRKLNYLAADHGFVNPFAHRALFDCATTYRLVSPHVDELVGNSYQKEWRISAVNAPFEKRDLLKKRRYRWDAERKVWYKNVLENQVKNEQNFLHETLGLAPGQPVLEDVSLSN